MKLYERLAEDIWRTILEYNDIESLKLFLKNLQEMDNPEVTEQLKAMLPEEEV